MKSLLSLLLIVMFTPILWAQKTTIYAQRGDTVVLEYTKSAKDTLKCASIYSTYFGIVKYKMKDSIVFETRVMPLNDSVMHIEFRIPTFFEDGQVLSLVLYDFFRPTPASCYSVLVDSAIIVLGGKYTPMVFSVSPNVVERGKLESFTIDFKGVNVKGKRLSEFSVEVVNGIDKYYLPQKSFIGINDSQMRGSFIFPKYIPDGEYYISADITNDRTYLYNFAVIKIKGGKPIPYIKSISPPVIGRGGEKVITINMSGTAFLSLPKRDIDVQIASIFDGTDGAGVTVMNDTTLQIKAKVSVALPDGYYSLTVGTPIDGVMRSDSAVSIVGGNPQVKIAFKEYYKITKGQKMTVVINGENTHFTTNTFTLTSDNPFEVVIDSVIIVDDVTLIVQIRGEDSFSPYVYGPHYFLYSDSEVINGVWVDKAILYEPGPTDSYISRMTPPNFYRNTTQRYTFVIRNNTLLSYKYKDIWQIGLYSIPNLQSPEILNWAITSDSIMYIDMKFDSSFTDTLCAVSLIYNEPGGYVFMSSYGTMITVRTNLKEESSSNYSSISVYPNPSSGEIYMSNNFNDILPVELKVFNIGGEVVFRKTIYPDAAEKNVSILPANHNLSNGLYFVEARQTDYTFRGKVSIFR